MDEEEPNGSWNETVAETTSGCGLSGWPHALCGPWIVVCRFLMRTVDGAGRQLRVMALVWTSGVVMMLSWSRSDEVWGCKGGLLDVALCELLFRRQFFGW